MLKHIVIVLVSMVSCLTGLFLYRFIPYKLHTLGYISIEESKNDMGEKTASETLMIIKGNYTANK